MIMILFNNQGKSWLFWLCIGIYRILLTCQDLLPFRKFQCLNEIFPCGWLLCSEQNCNINICCVLCEFCHTHQAGRIQYCISEYCKIQQSKQFSTEFSFKSSLWCFWHLCNILLCVKYMFYKWQSIVTWNLEFFWTFVKFMGHIWNWSTSCRFWDCLYKNRLGCFIWWSSVKEPGSRPMGNWLSEADKSCRGGCIRWCQSHLDGIFYLSHFTCKVCRGLEKSA